MAESGPYFFLEIKGHDVLAGMVSSSPDGVKGQGGEGVRPCLSAKSKQVTPE